MMGDNHSDIYTRLDPHGEVLAQRYSTYFAPTLKEAPAEAEIVSHKLLIRAGFIRRLAAGIYSYLPIGLRSLRKVERIIRGEMNRFGAREVLLPAVQPAELWKESGRWDQFGPELLRIKDRHDRDYVVGPTHEEVITDIIRREVRSFRDLPLNLFQIQTKFRDEIRPRFGLMRGREFIMKDGYSFDLDEVGAERSYQAMFNAYQNVFRRCGLKFAAVEANSGPIGGSYSHEFMVLADSGEDAIAFCPQCQYAANLEKATAPAYPITPGPIGQPLDKVYTPNCRHVPELARYLNVPEASIVKSLLFFDAQKNPLLVLIPGHREINLVKLRDALDGFEPTLASPEEAEKIMGVPMGYVTPIKAQTRIWADQGIERLKSGVAGAGEKDYHYLNAEVDRDFQVNQFLDLCLVEANDPCPKCGQPLDIKRGIEVGHVFKLGLKYSKALGATVTAADGSESLIVMGCYGIGVGRTLAAAAEQNHDPDGLVWPLALAPFQVALLPLQIQNPNVLAAAEELLDKLTAAGVEVLYDDRDVRPGVKFKDADLLGLPLRLTVSEKTLEKGGAELKNRADRVVVTLDLAAAPTEIVRLIKAFLAPS
ncbi:MAG: proline--tRNA ligase [Deltaproteobacteria bacterium]|jgi:prolyl-tRNA synthetase|nr:proline--tRNA ligase [Deltaproteobacteria bacterium]